MYDTYNKQVYSTGSVTVLLDSNGCFLGCSVTHNILRYTYCSIQTLCIQGIPPSPHRTKAVLVDTDCRLKIHFRQSLEASSSKAIDLACVSSVSVCMAVCIWGEVVKENQTDCMSVLTVDKHSALFW